MLILSKKTFAARTARQVECRPELRSGEMEKAPVYETGLQRQVQRKKAPVYKTGLQRQVQRKKAPVYKTGLQRQVQRKKAPVYKTGLQNAWQAPGEDGARKKFLGTNEFDLVDVLSVGGAGVRCEQRPRRAPWPHCRASCPS
jgi:hypothetical protein